MTLLLLAPLSRGPWSGLMVGMVGGLSFWLTHISWLTLYLGPIPWLALAVLQAVFFGVSLALIAVVLQLIRDYRLGRTLRSGIAVGAIAALLAIPALPTVQSGSTRLAAVQGASDAGLFARYAPGQILSDHASATLPLVGERVDFVVWPENSSDIDPTRSADAARVSDEISRAMNAPLVTGTITERDGKFNNSSLLWKAGQGAVGVYDKVHPVPFAECSLPSPGSGPSRLVAPSSMFRRSARVRSSRPTETPSTASPRGNRVQWLRPHRSATLSPPAMRVGRDIEWLVSYPAELVTPEPMDAAREQSIAFHGSSRYPLGVYS